MKQRRSSFRWLLASLLSGLSALVQPVLAAQPMIYFDVCPGWASARGHFDYYRTCKDRPFATGSESAYVWQLRQAQQILPGSVMLLDVLPGLNDRNPRATNLVSGYLAATEQVPGIFVAPMLDVVQPREATQQERINATIEFCANLIKQYGQHPGWYRINNQPVMTDYAHAGLGMDGLTKVQQELTARSIKLYWITDFSANVEWTVYGKVNKTDIQKLLETNSGVYAFTPPILDTPTDGVRQGYQRLRDAVASAGGDKLFGGAIAPGHWSSRLNQRNYASAMGTQRLRAALDALQATKSPIMGGQTWNDYVEAAHFEPSYKHTTALMEIIRAYAAAQGYLPPIDDQQPHVIVSYRKNLTAGEPLTIELLNLPIQSAFESLSGNVILTSSRGETISRLPFTLSGQKIQAVTLTHDISEPTQTINLTIELSASRTGSNTLTKKYINLPPIPLAAAELADPLFYSIPLHRLYTSTPLTISVNGLGSAGRTTSPRQLKVRADQPILGAAYMKNGAIINEPAPDTATKPVLENWADDPTVLLPPRDYYGALVEFADHSIAYSNILWIDSDVDQRIWCDYLFRREDPFPVKSVGKNKLVDRSHRQLHGTFGTGASGTPAAPKWVAIDPQHDALEFSNAVVSFPIQSFPAGPMTLETLYKPGAFGKRQSIIGQGGRAMSISIESDGALLLERLDDDRLNRQVKSTGKLSLNRWNYIVGTFDGKAIRLYINGEPQGQTACSGLRTLESVIVGGPASPGIPVDTGSSSHGQMARLRILSGATPAAEIQTDTQTLRPIYDLPAKE